jgi:predicted DNA-binding transcriptional regulator AlpA
MTSRTRSADDATSARLLSVPQLADYLGVPVPTIYR